MRVLHRHWAIVSFGLLIGLFGFFGSIPTISRAADGAVETKAATFRAEALALRAASETKQPDFVFNAIGAKWKGDPGAVISIRTKQGRTWSGWTALAVDEDTVASERDTAGLIYTNLLFLDRADAFQYQIDSAGSGISDLEAFVLKTTGDQPWFERWLGWLVPQAKGTDLNVISRADWGADESIRFDNDGNERWPVEYADPKVFILHHTAGSNGQPSLDQAKAVVRGIYYYHTVIRGWGDIGYNYLVDTAGNVFEGRTGGDGVVGAHTYRDANCPSKGEEQGYNSGSIGIAVLGNYEDVDTLSAEAKAAVSHLIAVKGRALGINPAAETLFEDRTIATVFGHSDVDCTICPGEHIKSELSGIRTLAVAEYETLPDYKGRLIESPFPRAVLRGQAGSVTFTYLNAGQEPWRQDKLRLRITGEGGGDPPFVIKVNNARRRSVRMTEETVEPGSRAHFTFTFESPNELGRYTQRFSLTREGQRLGRAVVIRTRVDSASQAALATLDVPVAMLDTWIPLATVKMKNTGVTTWDRTVVLKIMNDDLGPSSFYHPSWRGAVGEIVMEEASVSPGRTATYRFRMKAPAASRVYTQIFQLIDRDDPSHVIQHRRIVSLIRVDSTYGALESRDFSSTHKNETIPPALRSTWRTPVTIRFRNRGTQAWDRSVRLNVYGALFRRSEFRDGSWPRETGGILMNETVVRPGDVATFTFRLDAPDEPQVYKILFRLSRGPEQVAISGSYFSELIRVDP